jgi:hypothetical protein
MISSKYLRLVFHNNHRQPRSKNTYTTHWHGLPALLWLSSYVASGHQAVAPQSYAKKSTFCAVYNITLQTTCKARRVSKNLKKNLKVELKR